MNRLTNFGQKNIIIVFLSLLLLGKSVFKGDWDNTIAYSIIFAVTMFYTIGLNMVMRSKMDLKNTFIITAIFLILVGSVSMGKELVILSIIALIMLSLRYFLRYKGSPIINIATLGGLIIILMGYIYSSGIFIGWGGANYNLSIGGYRLPYGTILSVLACLSVIYLSKKYLYALGFFITYAILGYGIFGFDFIEYSFLDGTLYFFFGVMVLEPKTGIYGKYQLYYGILLGLMLLLFFKFQIPGDYFLALAIMNILAICDKHRMNREIKGKTYPVGQLWLCVPCGYIYDPVLGDTDSGIVAGTEFVDIPDNWRCPVCGVTKSDFIPYNGDEILTEGAKIISKTYLNPTTIELTIETEKKHKSMPGQFVGFFWEDEEGIFQRSYSIVKQDKNQLTFTIKLDPFGRGARILEKLVIGDKIRINGVFGNFLLQKSEYPKIFIATGTGLAPIYNMLLSLDSAEKKILYFSVATEGELFYVDKLKDIKNLELHIHITRENIDGYQTGRVDINSIESSPETEWYLCGNPKMVTEAIDKLQQRGFTKIFKEEF